VFNSAESTIVFEYGATPAGTLVQTLLPYISNTYLGATANFVTSHGGSNNTLTFSYAMQSGFQNAGTFYNGADYAYIDTSSSPDVLRAPNYTNGTDMTNGSGFTLGLTDNYFVKLTANTTMSTDHTINTLLMSGTAVNLNLGGHSLVLTNSGILKSNTTTAAASGSIIGGTITNGNYSLNELVVRVNATNESLTIGAVIADFNNGTALVKSGGGTLFLGGLNTFTGDVYLNQGVLALTNSLALQNN
jgi:autotransporter-associated beta strand protein